MDNEKLLRHESFCFLICAVLAVILAIVAKDEGVVGILLMLGMGLLGYLAITCGGICLTSSRQLRQLRERIEQLEQQIIRPRM